MRAKNDLTFGSNAHVIEGAESEVYPDAFAQMIVGWRAPRDERRRRPPWETDVYHPTGGRLARIDFAERVREFLDLGLD